MTAEALFPDDGLRVAPDPSIDDDRTPGQKLRDRQAARIAAGIHPLSYGGAYIRLHPDAPHDAHKSDDRVYPRCGTCRFRELVGGGNRDFPKCLAGGDGRVYDAPRYSAAQASDVRRWWPACRDWQPREPA